MSTLRIKDAPLLPSIDGSEKIPTGGKGDFSVTLDQVKTFARGGLPQQIEAHINDTSNPHQVTKDQVGLGNADNTSDIDKPVSTATQEALDLKANTVDVDNALNLKADKTYTDVALNLKADKSYVDSQDSLKADKTYVDVALSSLNTQASKFYPTLAEANADIANLTVNQAVQVGEAANGGLWYKATAGATSLTKSVYDPLTQASTRMDANKLFKPVDLVAASDLNNLPSEGYFRIKANASTMLNMPEVANGVVFEGVDSTGAKIQWFIAEPTNNYWWRTKWSSAWKEWKKAADSTQVIPVTSQKTGVQALSSYEAQGIYSFAASATISDLPTDAPTGVGYTMKVEDYLSGGRFKLQKLRCDSAKTGLRWERSLDAQNHTVGAWVFAARLHDNQIVASNLDPSFRYKGAFASVTMSDYKGDGLYTFTTPNDMPLAASSTSGLVDVKNWFSGSFVIQIWSTANKVEEQFIRLVRPTTVGEWVRIGGGTGSFFQDKKLVCFGDSITEFGNYPAQIATRLGLANGYNVGFGGTRLGQHEDQWYAPFSMYNVANYIATNNLATLMVKAEELNTRYADDNRAIVTRLQSINFTTVDYVTIFFGTNDWAGNVPIGLNSDTTGATFKGAINATVNSLLTAYPNLKIMFVTPIWRSRKVSGDGLESDTTPNDIGLYMLDYVNAITEVANLNKLPALDLYRESSINKYTQSLYLSTDGLHPSDAGYTQLANKIAAKLSASY